MPDLFNLIPGIGQLKGLLGPSVAETDSSLMPAPDPTTILGVPLQALGTAGIGWGLGRLLTNKRNRQIGQLRGLQLGLGLGMAPIQQEQAQYDKTMQAALDKGLLTPYQTPSPQPVSPEGGWQEAAPDAVASQAGLAAAPTTMTPAAPPSVNYGGMRLMATPRVNLGALYPGLPQGVANYQVIPTASDAYNAGQAAIAQAGEARAQEEDARLKEERQKLIGLATSRGITDAEKMPIRMLYERLARQQGLQDLTSMQGALAGSITPTSRVIIGVDANGNPTYQLQQISKAEIDAQADQRRLQEKQMENLTERERAQAEYEKARMEALRIQVAKQGEDSELKGMFDALEASKGRLATLDKQIETLGGGTLGVPKPEDAAAFQRAKYDRAVAQGQHDALFERVSQFAESKRSGQQPAPTPPPKTQKDLEAEEEARRTFPFLNAFFAAEGTIPSPPTTKEDKGYYADAAREYYEATDPPLAEITTLMRTKPFFNRTLSDADRTLLNQRYGEKETAAAYNRWYYGR